MQYIKLTTMTAQQGCHSLRQRRAGLSFRVHYVSLRDRDRRDGWTVVGSPVYVCLCLWTAATTSGMEGGLVKCMADSTADHSHDDHVFSGKATWLLAELHSCSSLSPSLSLSLSLWMSFSFFRLSSVVLFHTSFFSVSTHFLRGLCPTLSLSLSHQLSLSHIIVPPAPMTHIQLSHLLLFGTVSLAFTRSLLPSFHSSHSFCQLADAIFTITDI